MAKITGYRLKEDGTIEVQEFEDVLPPEWYDSPEACTPTTTVVEQTIDEDTPPPTDTEPTDDGNDAA